MAAPIVVSQPLRYIWRKSESIDASCRAPYHDGPQSVHEQISVLSELDHGRAVRFQHACCQRALVKRDSKWFERPFQLTTMKPSGEARTDPDKDQWQRTVY